MVDYIVSSAKIHFFNSFIMGEYIKHLKKDKKLLSLLGEHEGFKLEKKKNVYLMLCKSVISQQLSTKVAAVIYRRFLDLFGTKRPTAQQIVDISIEELRSVGLSNAKATYIQNIAAYALANKMTDGRLYKMTDEEVMEYLLPIKGVGKWTVEMQLMFTLGREDVFAVDDLGIQQAMTKLYKLDATDKKKMKEQMLKISAKWSPYRTYACLHLWHWKDS